MSSDESRFPTDHVFGRRQTNDAVRGGERVFRSPFALKCTICSQPLTIHEEAKGTTCSSRECQLKVTLASIARKKQRQQELRNQATCFRDSIFEKGTIDPREKIALAVLPANDNPLKELPKSRVRAFVDHLTRVISRAAEIHLGNVKPDDCSSSSVKVDEPTSATKEQLAILGNCCAVCRGNCCAQGGNHAFIQPDTIVSYMQLNPGERPRDVLKAYLSRIEFRSILGSCVYHGEQGCRLHRSMRSRVCNGYLCEGLEDVLDQLDDPSITKVAAISVNEVPNDKRRSVNDLDSVRKALIDQDGIEMFEFAGETDQRSVNSGSPIEKADDARE